MAFSETESGECDLLCLSDHHPIPVPDTLTKSDDGLTVAIMPTFPTRGDQVPPVVIVKYADVCTRRGETRVLS